MINFQQLFYDWEEEMNVHHIGMSVPRVLIPGSNHLQFNTRNIPRTVIAEYAAGAKLRVVVEDEHGNLLKVYRNVQTPTQVKALVLHYLSPQHSTVKNYYHRC